MKKLLTVLLSLLMVLTLAACGGNGGDTATDEPKDEVIKIAFCINGLLGDKSFFDSGNEGLERINKDFAGKVEAKVLEFTYDDTTWRSQLENVFMSEEYDVILVGCYDMLGMTVELTEEYPNQKVWFFDEMWDFDANPRENVLSLLFKQNEGSYLVGYMAAMASQTNRVSFCGGMSNTVLNDFAVGYTQGAKAYNPDCQVDITWMESFNDPTKGYGVADGSYSQGVDVIFACGGAAGLGVFDAAVEREGAMVIGVDGNQGAQFEQAGAADKAARTITSMQKNVGVGFYDTCKAMVEGTLEYGKNYRLGLEGGYVSPAITSATEATFTAEQLAVVEDLAAKISSGEIVVDTAF